MAERICEQCGELLMGRRKRFCSRVCRGEWESENLVGVKASDRKSDTVHVFCQECGRPLELPLYRLNPNGHNFCTIRCYGKWSSENLVGENCPRWRGGKGLALCAECGREIKIPLWRLNPKGRNFCTPKCCGKWKSKNLAGERSHTWRGGRSFEPYGPEFNKPRKRAIRERDEHRCAICGEWGKEVHHMNYDKKDSNPANLITLCKKCHPRTTVGDRDYWQRYFASHWLSVENWWEVSPANLEVGV